ncbi:T9SS type A sorting domain-containing protein [bacterium]|nr:T9SS type A sorting domain-containing protein [bacterium]
MKQRAHIILSPLFITALVLLFINDFFLKSAFPGVLTGKLSDFAGLFIFPLFLFYIIGKRKKEIFILTAVTFAFWKSPLSQGFIEAWNSLGILSIGRVIDFTDLIALSILPFAYHYRPKEIKVIRNPVFKFGIAAFTLFCIVASESNAIRFSNKAKGSKPYNLPGEYCLKYYNNDSLIYDTITIKHLKSKEYLIIHQAGDTLFCGEICKKKNDYFMNLWDEKNQSWMIGSFRIRGDSIFNIYQSISHTPEKLISGGYFENFSKHTKSEYIMYVIENERKETHRAFAKLLDSCRGYSFKRINESLPLIDTSGFEINEDNPLLSKTKVYPNPCQEQVFIEQGRSESYNLRLLNMKGSPIKTTMVNTYNFEWDLADVPAGNYFLQINYGDTVEAVKLVVQ